MGNACSRLDKDEHLLDAYFLITARLRQEDCESIDACHDGSMVGRGASATDGWYPENSVCRAGSMSYARLGPNDLLEMQCR